MITLNKNGLFNRFISVYGLRGKDCYQDTLCSLFMRSILGVLVVLHIIILPTLIVLTNLPLYFSLPWDSAGDPIHIDWLPLYINVMISIYILGIMLVQAGVVLCILMTILAFLTYYVSTGFIEVIRFILPEQRSFLYIIKQLKDKFCIKVNWENK